MRFEISSFRFQIGRGTGFTLVELLCGLSVTALVMTAMAGVMLAVSSSWRAHDPAGASQLQAEMSVRRLAAVIQPARAVGRLAPGTLHGGSQDSSAAVLLWGGDKNQDGKIQLSELVLIEHDRPGERILLYRVEYPAGTSAEQKEEMDMTLDAASIQEESAMQVFKSMNHVVARPLMGGVSGARFALEPATWRSPPAIQFALRHSGGSEEAIAYGQAVLRAAGEPE